jgi:hypothetical protein
LQFGIGFPDLLNPKKIPQTCRENLAILEKIMGWGNSKPTFHSWQKSKILLQNNLTIQLGIPKGMWLVAA